MIQEFSDFVIQQLNQTQLTINHMASYGIDVLYTATIHEVAYDSAARDPPHRCYPGTRDEDIDHTLSWALPSVDDNPFPLHWTRGAPGAGKSALVQTCVEALKDRGVPLVSFFFSKNRGWNNHRKFFPTIAYQLSTQFPDYRALLDTKVLHDKSLLYHKTMASQFNGLILDPLRELERIGKGIKQRIPVFIDALDECDSTLAQSQIIEIIAAAANDIPHIFCWAFFTRPEPHIEKAFARSRTNMLCCKTVLDPLPCARYEIGGVEALIKCSSSTQPVAETSRVTSVPSLFCRLFFKKRT